MLAVEVAVEAVVVAPTVSQQQRKRAGLSGRVAAGQDGRVVRQKADVDADRFVPAVGDRHEARIERAARLLTRSGREIGEVLVLALSETAARHGHPAGEPLTVIV